MSDSMDLSPISKLSCNFQELNTAGDREVRKTLFAPPDSLGTRALSASFSGLAELSSSASSIPTFKKPLGPSTKLARTKNKRKTNSFVGRSSQNQVLSTSSFPSTLSTTGPAPASTCEELSTKRTSRAQSFCFGDRSPLRDLSPYAGQLSCPTGRRASESKVPTLSLPIDQMEELPSEDKANLAPQHAGVSPYRPPTALQTSSPTFGRSSKRSGSMTDRSHLRRNVSLLASFGDDSDIRAQGDSDPDGSFRIHHRPSSGLSSSSSAIPTSPFASASSSSTVINSPFSSSAADDSPTVAAPSFRRLKTRNCRSLTMSCGSLPTLHEFSSASLSPSSSLSSSTDSLPSTSVPFMREAHVPVLPTNPHASHSDLPCIEPTTLLRLLRGEFDGLFSRLFIIDCRFKYEYDGGHIRGALNLNTTQDVERHFMLNPIPLREKVCIIFHCEFSSHRGPVLCRYLRSWDRKMHEHCYPELYYPEMYVLEGGYKKFWETPEARPMCEPEAYVPMRDSKFTLEMKHGLASIRNISSKKNSSSFRSRSWTVDARDEAMAALRPVRFPRLGVSSPLAVSSPATTHATNEE